MPHRGDYCLSLHKSSGPPRGRRDEPRFVIGMDAHSKKPAISIRDWSDRFNPCLHREIKRMDIEAMVAKYERHVEGGDADLEPHLERLQPQGPQACDQGREGQDRHTPGDDRRDRPLQSEDAEPDAAPRRQLQGRVRAGGRRRGSVRSACTRSDTERETSSRRPRPG